MADRTKKYIAAGGRHGCVKMCKNMRKKSLQSSESHSLLHFRHLELGVDDFLIGVQDGQRRVRHRRRYVLLHPAQVVFLGGRGIS